jgi:hypothetical protein
MEEGDMLQPISLLAPAAYHVAGLFHQSQAGIGVVVGIIRAAAAPATAAALTVSSLEPHHPDGLFHLHENMQQQQASRKGCGILARRRDRGLKRRLLEEQRS